jgi:ankyrin repeat protein
LLRGYRAGAADAIAEVNRFFRDADATTFALHDALLVVSRSYGFDSWPKLKAHAEGVTISRLIEAVDAGDVEQARAILRVRPELVNREAPSSHGQTALHHAVMRRNLEMIRALMQAGADPYNGTAGIYALREAANPLAMAVERGYDEIAAAIRVEEGRRESGRPLAGELPTGLRAALQTGGEERAIALLEQHPELVRFEAPDGRWSLLHIAAARLLPRTAAWLIDRGANVNGRAADGSLPLDVAGIHCNPADRAARLAAMMHLLRERGGKLTARAAVIAGDLEFLRREAAERDLITPQDDRGWLLQLAVQYDRPEILKLLLDLGLDPDARVRVGDDEAYEFTWGMPLYHCARHGKHAMAEILLERGADANGQVYASGTPLSEAYGQRDERMIALLERYGGKSNASMAGLYRRADLARRLLDEFGDTPLPDDGFSSGPVAEQLLGGAARGGDPEILRMAMELAKIPHGDPRWNGLLQGPIGFWNHWVGPWCHHEWDRGTYLTCFRMILERCGPPNAPLKNGATILHQIVVMGDHVTVEERVAFAAAALDAGARMDLRDKLLKSTPLGWACRWGHEELVRLFLERGADPIEKDAEQWATPLAWAEKKGHHTIAAMLRQCGDKFSPG